MYPTPRRNIWFYPEPIDFRKGLRGLVELVALDYEQNPGSGDLYVFRNKRREQIKMLLWQNDGFWLLQKRMEDKRFQFPKNPGKEIALNLEQLNWLLSGLKIEQAPPTLNPPQCYG